MILSKYLFEDFFLLVDVIKPPGTYINMTLWERAVRRRGCGLIVNAGAISKNDIFPDTHPYKYPYYSPFE